MKHSLRLTVLAVFISFSMVVAFGSNVFAKTTYNFKYANTQSENHPRSKSMVFFKDLVEKKSNNQIKFSKNHMTVLP